ncbi:hypothetical protein D3C81_680770 [compost metagenome]
MHQSLYRAHDVSLRRVNGGGGIFKALTTATLSRTTTSLVNIPSVVIYTTSLLQLRTVVVLSTVSSTKACSQDVCLLLGLSCGYSFLVQQLTLRVLHLLNDEVRVSVVNRIVAFTVSQDFTVVIDTTGERLASSVRVDNQLSCIVTNLNG